MITAGAGATGISLSFFGIDQTANSFRAIGGRIDALRGKASIAASSMSFLSRAFLPLLSIGAVTRAISGTARQLSALSDRAADAGVISPVLQKIDGAMRQLGVRGASIETISRALQNMTSRTGETGAEGLAKVLGQAGRLETEAERLTFLSQAFGRQQGQVFASIVRGGDASIAKFVELASTYPAVSNAAAQAGDRAADAMARATDQIKAAWGESLSAVIAWIEASFGPLPEVAAKVTQSVIDIFSAIPKFFRTLAFSVRVMIEWAIRFVTALTQSVGFLVEAIGSDSLTIREALSASADAFKTQYSDMRDGLEETYSSIFNPDIHANLETQGIFDGMKKAIGEGGVTFRNEAAKASEDLAGAMKGVKGGAWATEGSVAARRIISGDRYRDTGASAANRTVSNTLPTIATTLRDVAAATERTNDIFEELEAI